MELFNEELEHLKSIGNWDLKKILGGGSNGIVRLGYNKTTHQNAAVKLFLKSNNPDRREERARIEYSVLAYLQHDNILRLLETVDTPRVLAIVTEFASGGDLLGHIRTRRNMRLEETEARRLFKQILSSIEYAHSKQIIHRDLKAENIFLDSSLNVKVGDWGFAAGWEQGSVHHYACGSLHYAAPEICSGQEYTGPEVDVWSLGVLLFGMTTGTLPFFGRDDHELRQRICSATYSAPDYLSSGLIDLLSVMLRPSRYTRWSIEKIKNHSWISTRSTFLQLPYSRQGRKREKLQANNSSIQLPTYIDNNNPTGAPQLINEQNSRKFSFTRVVKKLLMPNSKRRSHPDQPLPLNNNYEQPKSPLSRKHNKTKNPPQNPTQDLMQVPNKIDNSYYDMKQNHHPKKTKLLGRFNAKNLAKSHDSKHASNSSNGETLLVRMSASFPTLRREISHQNSNSPSNTTTTTTTSTANSLHVSSEQVHNSTGSNDELKKEEVRITTPRSIAKKFNPLERIIWEKPTDARYRNNAIAHSYIEIPTPVLEPPVQTRSRAATVIQANQIPPPPSEDEVEVEELTQCSVEEPITVHQHSSQLGSTDSSTLYTSCSSSISVPSSSTNVVQTSWFDFPLFGIS
jgi:serine/threonine protein kinase